MGELWKLDAIWRRTLYSLGDDGSDLSSVGDSLDVHVLSTLGKGEKEKDERGKAKESAH